jgi:hypothetical protein
LPLAGSLDLGQDRGKDLGGGPGAGTTDELKNGIDSKGTDGGGLVSKGVKKSGEKAGGSIFEDVGLEVPSCALAGEEVDGTDGRLSVARVFLSPIAARRP